MMIYFASKQRTEMLKSSADEKKRRCGKGWEEVRDMKGENMMWEIKVWAMSMQRGGMWWDSPVSAFFWSGDSHGHGFPSSLPPDMPPWERICTWFKINKIKTYEITVVQCKLFSSCSHGCTSYPFWLSSLRKIWFISRV